MQTEYEKTLELICNSWFLEETKAHHKQNQKLQSLAKKWMQYFLEDELNYQKELNVKVENFIDPFIKYLVQKTGLPSTPQHLLRCIGKELVKARKHSEDNHSLFLYRKELSTLLEYALLTPEFKSLFNSQSKHTIIQSSVSNNSSSQSQDSVLTLPKEKSIQESLVTEVTLHSSDKDQTVYSFQEDSSGLTQKFTYPNNQQSNDSVKKQEETSNVPFIIAQPSISKISSVSNPIDLNSANNWSIIQKLNEQHPIDMVARVEDYLNKLGSFSTEINHLINSKSKTKDYVLEKEQIDSKSQTQWYHTQELVVRHHLYNREPKRFRKTGIGKKKTDAKAACYRAILKELYSCHFPLLREFVDYKQAKGLHNN